MPQQTSTYAPCVECCGTWANGRYHHRKGCSFIKKQPTEAITPRPLPESIHVLIDRFGMAYHRMMILEGRISADPKSKELSSESLSRARAALNAAISAHRHG
jgi:hypothetical protein